MNTGTRIKKLRKEQHLTQAYLAKKVGITKAAVSKYEKNLVKNIPNDKLQKIAKALNTSTQYLLGLPGSVKLYCKPQIDDLITEEAFMKPEVDLSSNNFAYVYKGRKVTSEEMKYIRRILKSTD